MNSTLSFWPEVRQSIPAELLARSGKVFYSGRAAFTGEPRLYILGVNPGGDPSTMQDETIDSHTEWVSNKAPADWSAYRDERWKGKPPGRHGMQPRILHMFNSVSLQPGAVPASNLIFVRSRRENNISEDFEHLAGLCWPFHRYVIEKLKPKVILCLGKTAGDYIRKQTKSNEQYATFIEQNNRRWQSAAYRSEQGLKVVVATHPSIADWTAHESDPTPLVASALHDA
jgi:hypothetical protein